jgi:hypothetical protein
MSNIKSIVRGAYDPQVELEDGKVISLTSYINDLAITSQKKVTLSINGKSHPVLTYVNSREGEAWYTDSPDLAVGIQTLYVPTLAELGLPPGTVLQAQAQMIVTDQNATADPVDIRVIDIETGDVVIGSEGTATASGSISEVEVKSDFFTIQPGKSYTVDARKRDVAEAFFVSFGRFRLLVRV